MRSKKARNKTHKASVYYGLNKSRRIQWDDHFNRICITLANLGFHVDTIAANTGLTKSQVMYRCRKKGLSVTDYRKGTSTRAMTILNRYTLSLKEKTA